MLSEGSLVVAMKRLDQVKGIIDFLDKDGLVIVDEASDADKYACKFVAILDFIGLQSEERLS